MGLRPIQMDEDRREIRIVSLFIRRFFNGAVTDSQRQATIPPSQNQVLSRGGTCRQTLMN